MVADELRPTQSDRKPIAASQDLLQTMQAPLCQWVRIGSGRPVPCPGDPVPTLEGCADGDVRPPLWQRTRPDARTAWEAWRLVGPAVCATAAEVTGEQVLAELRRLPLAPSAFAVEPDRGWALVNMPTYVHADAAPQTLATTILGTPVTITATPAGYSWDFGDGATLASADPGRPWPDGDLGHAYPRTGTYTITLTTTWSATYTVGADPTVREVPGTARTTSAADPVTVEERRGHLVAGSCADDATAPGCG